MESETIGGWTWQRGWGFAVWRGPDGRAVGLHLNFQVGRWCVWTSKPPAVPAYDYRPVVVLHDGPHAPLASERQRAEIGRLADAALTGAGWCWRAPGDAARSHGLLAG